MRAPDAGRARWRGQPGRLEVWYATATDASTGTGLWVHHEVLSPVDGSAYSHGWLAVFPPDRPAQVGRFGPAPIEPVPADGCWVRTGATTSGPGRLTGRGEQLSWDLSWHGDDPPLWTFPSYAWRREVLPAAQVVVAPRARFRGHVQVDGQPTVFDGVGQVGHIYGHGNAERWAWLHADLDADTVLELVVAVGRRPALRRLPALAFVQLRQAGLDWPRDPLLAAPLFRSSLDGPHWSVRGNVGRLRLTVRVSQPAERCVSVDYTDPDGSTATCTNTERADVEVALEARRGHGWQLEREWRLAGTGHAERGTRLPAADRS